MAIDTWAKIYVIRYRMRCSALTKVIMSNDFINEQKQLQGSNFINIHMQLIVLKKYWSRRLHCIKENLLLMCSNWKICTVIVCSNQIKGKRREYFSKGQKLRIFIRQFISYVGGDYKDSAYKADRLPMKETVQSDNFELEEVVAFIVALIETLAHMDVA